MIAPLKQLERLFGESVLPLISYAPFNESCSRFRSSAGSRHGENRTVEYTTGTKPGEYRIAREVSAGRKFDVWANARLFALVNLAMANGYIAGFEDKYYYNYWWPVTAIRERGDSAWLSCLPTPPVPEFPSNHTVEGAAAATVMARFFNTDFVSFSMNTGSCGRSWTLARIRVILDGRREVRMRCGQEDRKADGRGV